MTGRELAEQVAEEFGTREIGQLARRSGLSIRLGRWTPVTAGELDVAANEITVNEDAEVEPERIVAHELGHYFIRSKSIVCTDAEKFCDDFADAIMAKT